MAKRSLKASQEGIIIAKKAFDNRQWSQEYLAAEVGLSTRNSIWKFFSGRAIERNIFMEICFKLDLEWEDIADLPNDYHRQSSVNQRKNTNEIEKEDKNILVDNQDELETLRSQLEGQIQAQCGNIQTYFNINQQLPLKSVYINLEVLKSIRSQRWLDLSEFKDRQIQLKNNQLYSTEETTIPAINAVNSHRRLIIVGQIGSGKSTFLQSLALRCIEQQFQPESLPIFISLKILVLQGVPKSNFSLIEYIKKTWSVSGIPSEKIDFLATQGKILVLLDGLEEVCNQDNQIILAAIQQFTILYHQCKVIVTCRVGTPINILQGFHCVELAELNEKQVQEFIEKWFTVNNLSLESPNNLGYTHLLELLKSPENLLIKELTKSPILLSLLCSVFQERGKFPNKLSKLYQEALEILFKQNDDLFINSFESDNNFLSLTNKLEILSEIAHMGLQKEKFYYEKQELIDIITGYLKRQKNYNYDVYYQAEKTIQLFIRNYGLLVEVAKGIFAFSHLTFQEYLTAKKLIDDFKQLEEKQELQKLAGKIHLRKWRSLIFLILEMLPERETFISLIKKEINSIIEDNEKLKDFFLALQKKENSLNSAINSEAIIAFYLGLLQTRDLNLASALDIKLSNQLPQELALDLALIRVLNLAEQLSQYPSLEGLLELGFSLDLEQKFALDMQLQDSLQKLKNQLINQLQDNTKFLKWWDANSSKWIKQLRKIIIEYRLIGQDWQFNQEETQVLYDYYDKYLFLTNCINRVKSLI